MISKEPYLPWKPLIYVFLAVLPSLTQPTDPPANAWEWFKYLAMAAYQGLLALKAYQSQAESIPNDSPQPVEIVPTPENPVVQTQETQGPPEPAEYIIVNENGK